MITLLIARHGQTEENVARILQGQIPGHLTEEGISQARQMREQLKDTRIDLIVSSDLKRATDTAAIISEPHGGHFITEPLLRERDFGKYTGEPYINISRAIDDPNAETMEQVSDRAIRFLTKLAREHDGETILAVSHGLFLRVLQSVFHHADIHDIPRMDNAEIRTLTLSPGQEFTVVTQEVGTTAN